MASACRYLECINTHYNRERERERESTEGQDKRLYTYIQTAIDKRLYALKDVCTSYMDKLYVQVIWYKFDGKKSALIFYIHINLHIVMLHRNVLVQL